MVIPRRAVPEPLFGDEVGSKLNLFGVWLGQMSWSCGGLAHLGCSGRGSFASRGLGGFASFYRSLRVTFWRHGCGFDDVMAGAGD